MVETADGFIVAVPARDRRGRSRRPIRPATARCARRCARSIGDRHRRACSPTHCATRAQPRINQPVLDNVTGQQTMNIAAPPALPASAPPMRRDAARWCGGAAWPIWKRRSRAFLKLAHGRPNSFLLESVEGGAARGRYSIIGMEPDLIWRCRDGRAEVNRHALSAPHAFVAERAAGARQPARADRRDAARRAGHLPPMAGGLVGYLGYDMVRLMERLPDEEPRRASACPKALLMRPTLFAIFDNVNDELTLVAPVYPQADMRRPRRRGSRRRGGWARRRRRWNGRCRIRPPPVMLPDLPAPASNFTKPDFLAAVGAVQGVHRRRRRVPDRAQPALLGAVRAAAVLAVPRAAADQPGAVPVLSRFRRLRGRWGRAPRCWCGCATAR